MRFSAIRKVIRSADASWDGYELSFWSSCEYHLAIITACIPTIKPLYVIGVNKILALIRRQSPTKSKETDETSIAHRSKFVQPEPKFLMEV